MKTNTFRQVLIQSDAEVHREDRTRKIAKNLYAHYWDDGLIQRRDLYWFDGQTVLLESAWQRYNGYDAWFLVQ